MMIIGALDFGGAERVTATLANAWSSRGHEVSILSMSPGESAFPLSSGVKLIAPESSTSRRISLPHMLSFLRRKLKELEPEICLAQTYKPAFFASLACVGLGIPLVAVEHNYPGNPRLGRIWPILRYLAYSRADKVVFLTERARSHFSGAIGRHSAVIENPLAEEFLAEDSLAPCPSEREGAEEASTENKRFLAIGRLVEQKGFDLLLRAFAQFSEAVDDWSLTIVGEGKLQWQLHSMVQSLGLEQRVTIRPFGDSPLDYYRSSDVFVLSSRWEGFPCVLCEAMSCALAPIAFDCPTGPAELIEHELSGLLIPPGDWKALARAMKRLVREPELRKKLARGAIELRSRLETDKILEQWDTYVFSDLESSHG